MKESALPCPVCGSKTIYPYLEVRDHAVSGELFQLERCSACDFLRTSPQIPTDKIGLYYQSDGYLSHKAKGSGLTGWLYARARRKMLGWKQEKVERASGKTSGRLLDYGAGIGFFSAHMAQAGWDVSGIEPSAEARAVAQREVGLTLQDEPAFWSLPDESFDVITLWHVLEHVHELDRTLAKLADLLTPGGTLLIAVPNALSADACHYQANWAAWDAPRHLWHFSPENLKTTVEKTGLSFESLHALPLDAYYIALRSEQFIGHKPAKFWGWQRGRRFARKGKKNPSEASSILCAFQKAN